MTIAIVILSFVAAIVVISGTVFTAMRRSVANTGQRRREAQDTRAIARATQLEADRQAAHSAEQQQLTAWCHRSSALDLLARADAFDPDF